MAKESFSFEVKEDIPCHAFNVIGFVLFLLTTIKSLYDLVADEIVCRNVPLGKLTLSKIFHVLLPFSQFAICFSCVYFNMYCVEISEQEIAHTILTAGGGYVVVLCFFLNSLHWGFLLSQSIDLVHRVFISVAVILVFALGPLVLESLIVYFHDRDKDILSVIHFVELVYIVVLNLIVIICMITSWALLRRRLNVFSGLEMIAQLRKRLTLQMCLYIVFFLIRAVCLLVTGILGYAAPNFNRYVRYSIFFASSALGDVPLIFVILYFLSGGRASSSSSSSSLSSDGATPNTPLRNSYTASPQLRFPKQYLPDDSLAVNGQSYLPTPYVGFVGNRRSYYSGCGSGSSDGQQAQLPNTQRAPFTYTPQLSLISPSLNSNPSDEF